MANERFLLTIDSELKAKVKELADNDKRSISNYIVVLLEKHIEDIELEKKLKDKKING